MRQHRERQKYSPNHYKQAVYALYHACGTQDKEEIMASIQSLTTKDGKPYYRIRCRISRDKPTYSTCWYPPEGWSKRAIERELTKQAAEFERQCKAGEILSRTEQKAKQAEEQRQAESIQTVKQYGERVFMPAKAVTCSENTRCSFQSMLDLHIYPTIGETKLPDITSATLTALLLDFQASGRSHATCVKLYTILNLLFKMAYLGDIIERNPMDKVMRPKPRKDEVKQDKVDSFTIEELRYIFSCLDKEPLKWRAYLRLMADTGIRRGEACGLTWACVSFEDNTITIKQTLNYTKDAGAYIDNTKNGKSRTVDVDPSVMELLKELRSEQASRNLSRYVFTQDDSAEPMFPQSPGRYMQTFSRRYGVNHLHPHKLRHSFASIAITNGADVASISEILGHSDKAVTLRVYSHSDQASRKRASNIFRDALKNVNEA